MVEIITWPFMWTVHNIVRRHNNNFVFTTIGFFSFLRRLFVFYLQFLTVNASLTPFPLTGCVVRPMLLSVVVLPVLDRQPSPVPFGLPKVPYTLPPWLLPPTSNCRAYELSAYAWKQHLTGWVGKMLVVNWIVFLYFLVSENYVLQ